MKWEKKPLKEVADFSLGKMLDQRKNKGEPLPYLANINVRWGEFELDDLRQMPFESNEMERFGLEFGDIVMCEGGEPGRCALWKEPHTKMMIQKALHRIRPHSCLDNRFLFYSLLHKGKEGGFSQFFTGSTIKHLPRQQLAKVEIDIPPLSTQRNIGSILATYDDLIENNRRRMALLEEATRQVYQEWFVRLRFPGYEHTRIVDGVPEGWDRMPLESALVLQRGFDLPSQDRLDGSVPIYASTGVNGRHNVAKAKAPGVVTGRSGSLGMVHYVHEDYWPLNTTLWVKEFRRVSPLFAFFLLSALRLDQYNGGVSVPTLDRKVVHKIEVVVPNSKTQALFDDYMMPMFTHLRNLGIYNDKLRTARDLLLPKLMSGEIRV